MTARNLSRPFFSLAFVILLVLLLQLFVFAASRAQAAPFTSLQPGFQQKVFGVMSHFEGGIAFAPDGDVWVNYCQFAGSPLVRMDLQTTTIINGTVVHPQAPGSPFPSNAGCGITNHPDGTLYSNTSSGITNLDANTGALIRTIGPAGNALGITVDPQNGHLIYVGVACRFTATCPIIDLDPVSGASTPFATLSSADASFVDGLAFDSSGNFLFMSNRAPAFRLTILNRSGALVRHVPMTSEPDGIAFSAATPKFVVTVNTDGTITRFNFPNDDFTQPPTTTVPPFASGGFRGDLSQVGADGCLYLPQDGTRYDNGTVSFENSVVQVCPNFVPPPGVGSCGDGQLDPGEQCDDGNRVNGDGCDYNCKPTGCGNGVVSVGEACDDSNTTSGDGCSSICQIEAGCGNGHKEAGELCDDGNLLDDDGCSHTCRTERCGDGAVQTSRGEQCDDGNLLNGDGCSQVCQAEDPCGNGILEAGEECDDGNHIDHDGCSEICLKEELCGNGQVDDPEEECDDGNQIDNDGCTNECELETEGDPACGNHIIDPGEECDDGNQIDSDGCSNECEMEGHCGNGEIDEDDEQCDDANFVDGDGCSHTCQLEICGDGIVQLGLGEQCDDGNTAPGDGCSVVCKTEAQLQALCAVMCAKPEAQHVDAKNHALKGTKSDDILCGDERNNKINGLDGNDILCGFGGDDTLNGGKGEDVLDGGPGEKNRLNGGAGIDGCTNGKQIGKTCE